MHKRAYLFQILSELLTVSRSDMRPSRPQTADKSSETTTAVAGMMLFQLHTVLVFLSLVKMLLHLT